MKPPSNCASMSYASMQLWRYASMWVCEYDLCKFASMSYASKQYVSMQVSNMQVYSMQVSVYNYASVQLCKYACNCTSMSYASM